MALNLSKIDQKPCSCCGKEQICTKVGSDWLCMKCVVPSNYEKVGDNKYFFKTKREANKAADHFLKKSYNVSVEKATNGFALIILKSAKAVIEHETKRKRVPNYKPGNRRIR